MPSIKILKYFFFHVLVSHAKQFSKGDSPVVAYHSTSIIKKKIIFQNVSEDCVDMKRETVEIKLNQLA